MTLALWLLAYVALVSLAFLLSRPPPDLSTPADPAPESLLPSWLRPSAGASPLVRVGRDHDGGYVLPASALADSDALLSLGVNDDWSFERDYLRRASRPVEAYDPTVGFVHFLGRGLLLLWHVLAWPLLSGSQRRLVHGRRPWATLVDYLRFFRGEARHLRLWVGAADAPGSVSLASALASPRLAARRRVLVKMDIEGAEYAALAALPARDLERVDSLVVEFHQVPDRLGELRALADRLAPAFAVRHVHANNYAGVKAGLPEVLEVTWTRRAPGDAPPASPRLPLPGLDQPNRAGLPDIVLRFPD